MSDLEDQSVIEMDWAYWATEPQKMTMDPKDYRHAQDIRLDQLSTNELWNLSENGTLITRSNRKIHYHGDFIRLFCARLSFLR